MSLVAGEDIVSPDPHKVETGAECSVKIERKIWPLCVCKLVFLQPPAPPRNPEAARVW